MSTKAEELAEKIISPTAGPWNNLEAAAELRRLAAVEQELADCKAAYESQFKELHALKASIGEPVAWHSPDETEGVTGLVWLRENGGIFLGYYFDQPFREYRDTDGHYVGQQDAETYWARHEDGEPCNPDGWCELLPPLYAIKDKQP